MWRSNRLNSRIVRAAADIVVIQFSAVLINGLARIEIDGLRKCVGLNANPTFRGTIGVPSQYKSAAGYSPGTGDL